MKLVGERGFLGKHLARLPDFADGRKDVVVNAAGRVRGIRGNMMEPARMIVENLQAAIGVFEKARWQGVKRVVNFGSTCAYSPDCAVPFDPQDYLKGEPEKTNGAYAMAKRAIFEMSRAYSKQYGMDNLYIVMPNLYGPGDRWWEEDAHVIPSMIRKFYQAIRDGKEVVLYGTGAAEREFLFVEDAARTVPLMIEDLHTPDPVHLSSGETILVKDLAELIAKEMGYSKAVVWDASKPDGQMKRLLSPGYKPCQPVSFLEGIRRSIDDFKTTLPREGYLKRQANG